MEEVKSKLHYLKTKILQYSEIPDNIRLELSNDIFKVEQALTIHSVVVNEANPNSKEHQAKLLREIMQGDEELGLYSEVALCEHPMSERADIANSNRT